MQNTIILYGPVTTTEKVRKVQFLRALHAASYPEAPYLTVRSAMSLIEGWPSGQPRTVAVPVGSEGLARLAARAAGFQTIEPPGAHAPVFERIVHE